MTGHSFGSTPTATFALIGLSPSEAKTKKRSISENNRWGMIHDYDESLEKIVQSFIPKWTELRARKSDFAKLDENTFKSLSFVLVGEPSLLCFADSKDLVTPRIEYFPICIQRADANTYDFEQTILARAGGNLNSSRTFNGCSTNLRCDYWKAKRSMWAEWGLSHKSTPCAFMAA
jgi:hypothetical protein